MKIKIAIYFQWGNKQKNATEASQKFQLTLQAFNLLLKLVANEKPMQFIIVCLDCICFNIVPIVSI